MKVEERQNGYDVHTWDELGDGLIRGLARRFSEFIRFTGSFWAVNYGIDTDKNEALQRAVKRTRSTYQKQWTAAILHAPQTLGEIKPLPELELQIPLRRPLYPYQGPGVQYNLDHKKVIIGDQPGLGKTTIAAATLLAQRGAKLQTTPALIVCPTTIKRKWQRELLAVTGYNALILDDKRRNTWPAYLRSGNVDAIIVNFESLRKYFVQAITNPPGVEFRLKDVVFRPELNLFRTVIIDEIHRAKDYTTQTAKFLKGITESPSVEYVFGLTGTLLVNKPDDLIAQLSIIGRLQEFGGLSKFKARYCTTVERTVEEWDPVAREKVPVKKKIYPNLEELNYLLTERCFYRREKKDVLKDLPDKTRQIVTVEITNREEYNKAETRFEEYLKTIKLCSDYQIAKKMRAQALVQMGLLGEISARGKMAAVKEWGENLIESGEKIVMFSELQDVIEATKKLFPGCLEISGQITGDRRDRAVQLFQNNPERMAISCNIKAGGVGIDLFVSSHVGFIMLPWHHADLEQCEDRCHRNGQKNAVLSALFIGEGTVDEYRWSKIQEKRTIANAVHGASDEISEEAVEGLLSFFAKRKRRATSGALNF